MKYVPHKYQEFSTKHIVDNPYSGLFLDMGLGKTVSTLTAINDLMFDYFQVRKVLVIAPLRVARDTWPDEIQKWDHLKHLQYALVLGSEKDRIRALKSEADIYIINRENVAWMVSFYGNKIPFDMLVVDELSSFKSAKSQRFKALKRIVPLFDRRVGLTGTPAPNGLADLWPQLYLLDRGERLGKSITDFRENYCYVAMAEGNVVYKYGMKPTKRKEVYDLIGDICVSMKSRDYLELPPQMDIVVNVKLDEATKEAYDDFARERIMDMLNQSDYQETGVITAVNAAALMGKLSQFANGAVYDETRRVHNLHEFKMEAFEEIVEEANGDPILSFYSYKHDLERIKKSKKIGKLVRTLDTAQDMKDWNDGKIQLLMAHPASAGHGLNLQKGGATIVWFGIPWSLELYLQAVARLMRQGQTRPVKNYILAVEDTVDYKILAALKGKNAGQQALMDAVKALVNQYV